MLIANGTNELADCARSQMRGRRIGGRVGNQRWVELRVMG